MQLEAIPESLKNMLLVMDTAGIFHSADSRTGFSDLWEITWERIICFLPNLREELFKQTVIAGTGQALENFASFLFIYYFFMFYQPVEKNFLLKFKSEGSK